jgi:hypothetical protein
MPKYTNKHNLPDSFYRVIQNDTYSKGNSDFSATGLQTPPRAFVLFERHKDELEIDISTRVAATLGQGTHSILERAARPGDVYEKRFFAPITVNDNLFTISAQIDLWEHDTKVLSDWKTTKVYTFHKGNRSGGKAKPEWVQQLNVGAYLMRLAGYEVKALQIIGILKDWDLATSKKEVGYPPIDIVSLDVEMWPDEKTRLWIEYRIYAFLEARIDLPECGPVDHWNGNRCSRYCDVNQVCEQYQKARRTGRI